MELEGALRSHQHPAPAVRPGQVTPAQPSRGLAPCSPAPPVTPFRSWFFLLSNGTAPAADCAQRGPDPSPVLGVTGPSHPAPFTLPAQDESGQRGNLPPGSGALNRPPGLSLSSAQLFPKALPRRDAAPGSGSPEPRRTGHDVPGLTLSPQCSWLLSQRPDSQGATRPGPGPGPFPQRALPSQSLAGSHLSRPLTPEQSPCVAGPKAPAAELEKPLSVSTPGVTLGYTGIT